MLQSIIIRIVAGILAIGISTDFGFAQPKNRANKPAALPARPNVLFVMVDDLNDWVSVLGGYPGVKTPNIERLAKRGMLFTRAYCASPICSPSRTSLMTGVRPSSSGIYTNFQHWRPVLPEAVTIPQHFMAHSYEAVGTGKIYHNSLNDPASWERYLPIQESPEPANAPVNGLKRGHFDWGAVSVKDTDMGDFKNVDFGIQFLQQKYENPFFLAVGIYRPHLPWYVPQSYFEQYPLDKIRLPEVKEDDLADVPPAGVKMAAPGNDHRKVIQAQQWKKAVQGYLASITFADAMLGRLLDALEDSAYKQNTVIVFLSDHGWHLGEKKHWRKFALWEEATRVPLLVVAPGLTKPGSVCHRTVNLMDVYPTLIEVCKLKARPEIEGRSLVPLLRQPFLAWEYPSVTTYLPNNHAVRSERWRYIRYHDGFEELYDHQNDPNEWNNLAVDPQWAAVKKELAAWLPRVNVASVPEDKENLLLHEGIQKAKK